MKYTKPALSFPQQADLLIGRGLVADRAELIQRLSSVSYYRLSAYWYTFRILGDPDDKLIAGTTLATVWKRYVFDRQLRLLVSDQTFAVLTLLYFLLRQVAPQSAWKSRLTKLLTDYSDVPIRFMGFPANWEECPIWKDTP